MNELEEYGNMEWSFAISIPLTLGVKKEVVYSIYSRPIKCTDITKLMPYKKINRLI